tara:strand:- start:257 stop:568 length:312 start_codon:yes stop_codon:yes gene_type:complete
MANEIHVDDIGTRFLLTVKDSGVVVNLAPATLLQVNFRKPDDTVVNKTASTLVDGSIISGVMYYDTIAGDLDQAGHYKLQGKVSLTSGTYYTDIHTFKVHCNL